MILCASSMRCPAHLFSSIICVVAPHDQDFFPDARTSKLQMKSNATHSPRSSGVTLKCASRRQTRACHGHPGADDEAELRFFQRCRRRLVKWQVCCNGVQPTREGGRREHMRWAFFSRTAGRSCALCVLMPRPPTGDSYLAVRPSSAHLSPSEACSGPRLVWDMQE
jgi:hypothetical protein